MRQCGSEGVQKGSRVVSKPKVYFSKYFSNLQMCLGNWNGLNSVYRGCAVSIQDNETRCKSKFSEWIKVKSGESDTAQVRVEVYMCYCFGERCNKKDITAGTSRVGGGQIKPDNYISSVIFIMFAAILMFINI